MSSIPGYKGDINPTPGHGETRISIYLYRPWFGGAIAGAVTFGIVLCVQLFFLFKYKRTRWFHGLLALGSLMEVGGYAARIRGHANQFLINVFIVQYFLIVVAPIPIAAAIYLVLTYASKRFPNGRSLLAMRPNWILWFFVLMDVATIAVQVCGAALVGIVYSKQARGESTPVTTETANNILRAGLAVQTASFTGFLFLLVVAIFRTKKLALPADQHRNIRRLLCLNLLTALLVLLRTVYRLAVEIEGYFGSANQSQILFTCLEYLPVILALALFSIVPIASFFPREDQAGEHVPMEPFTVKDTY